MGIEELINYLVEGKINRVLIQFPEGLKLKIRDIVREFDKKNIEVVICLEPTYGSCDIREPEAIRLGCKSIVHLGHSDYGIKSSLPVVYWEYFLDADPIPALEKNFNKLKKFDKIGLVTSLQYIPALQKAKKFLESKGKKIFTFKTEQYEGQILGCRVGAATNIENKVDAFLCITAGKFYSSALLFKISKPKFALDLEKNTIEELSAVEKKLQKIKEWNKAQFAEAKNIGLLVSWKRGQMFGSPFDFKKKLEKVGKNAYILAMDEISAKKLEGLKLDLLINFACPRIESPELSELKIPMLNYHEIKI